MPVRQRPHRSVGEGPRWTFLTNHAHVLICLSRDPTLRGWEIADLVGITERATQKIISDLVEEGYLIRHREGRRNRYEIATDLPLRHPLEADHPVGDLLRMASPVGARSRG